MMRLLNLIAPPRQLLVHTDGAIRPEKNVSGLAAVARDETGNIHAIWTRRAGRMTCNEAEYAAAILALESLRHAGVEKISIFSDSQVMVNQMNGIASAQAPALKQAQARLRALVVQFHKVEFQHIPREQNRLADALANEAADGKEQSYG